jgi:ketosteroid isomerase-like protein
MKILLSLFPLLLLISGCNQGSPSTDSSALTARSDAWEEAQHAKDIDTLADLYTSDARLLSPNKEMASGQAAVRSELGAMIDAGLGISTTVVEATVSGDIGYIVGTFVIETGDDVVDNGKYVETWRRGGDGQWRISNDIYNSDRPAKKMKSDMDMMSRMAKMTHVMITHEVDDAEHWMAAWRGEDSRHKLFKENGAMRVHTFVSADNPNLTGLVIGVRDMEALQAMLASEEGKAAAAEDGVRMDTINLLTEAK